MVETIGVEPMTSCMSSMRSNQLSYASGTAEKAEFLSTTYILYHIRRKNAIGFLIFSAGFPDFFCGRLLAARNPGGFPFRAWRRIDAGGSAEGPEAIGKCQRRSESAGGGADASGNAKVPGAVRRRRMWCADAGGNAEGMGS